MACDQQAPSASAGRSTSRIAPRAPGGSCVQSGEPNDVSPRILCTTDVNPFWVHTNGWTAARDHTESRTHNTLGYSYDATATTHTIGNDWDGFTLAETGTRRASGFVFASYDLEEDYQSLATSVISYTRNETRTTTLWCDFRPHRLILFSPRGIIGG